MNAIIVKAEGIACACLNDRRTFSCLKRRTLMDSTNKKDSAEVQSTLQSRQHTGKDKSKECTKPASGWIAKFRKRPGNEWLEEVDREFLKDFTNLMGLEDEISFMSQGLHAILSDGLYLDSNGNSKVSLKTEAKYLDAAETLYCLIHVRYLFTSKGLDKVLRKYKEGIYGECPRHYCEKTNVLPIGISDKVGQDNVKVYCPSCEDVYHSCPPGDPAPDGAYFGMNLPQFFFMAYPALHPAPTIGRHVPQLFGFRIHGSVKYAAQSEPEVDKSNHKSLDTKHTRTKTKTKDKLKDTKKHDATQENKLNCKLPYINGHVQLEKTPRRRRRHKKTVEVKEE